MSVPCTRVVTKGAQLAARSSVIQAGQAMAQAVAADSSGTWTMTSTAQQQQAAAQAGRD
jgi:hypothetical protein